MDLLGRDLNAAQLVVVIVCAFLGGFSKTGIVGLGIVITPLLASVFPAGTALGFLLPIFMVGDVISITRSRNRAPWGPLLVALPWGAAGTMIGWVVAKAIGDRYGADAERVLRVAIGILMGLVVVGSAYLSRHPEYILRRDPSAGTSGETRINTSYAAGLGLFSGFTNMLTNSGGPIWAVYFSSLDLEVKQVIACGVRAVFLCNLIKLPFSAHLGFLAADTLMINLLLIPVLVLGIFVGDKVAGRYSKETFARIIRCLALFGAFYMVAF